MARSYGRTVAGMARPYGGAVAGMARSYGKRGYDAARKSR